MSEEWLEGVGGVRLFARRWTAEQAVTSALIVHGIGEHSGRYEATARRLARQGLGVFAYDQRGHGRSEGRRGHVNRFDEYLDDVERAAAWATQQQPHLPLVLIGHSLGGLIALHAAARRPSLCRGLALSSPACGLTQPVPAWKQALAVLAGVVWPTFSMARTRRDGAYLSHDPAVGPAYVRDPLVHFRITARCYLAIRQRMRTALEAAGAIGVPTLIFQAGDDHLVDAEATRAVASRIAAQDRQLVWLDGWYHEVFNEVERARVLEQLAGWVRQRAGAA